MQLFGMTFAVGEITDLMVAVLGFIGVVIAAWLAYMFATRQSRITHNTTIRTDRLRREIAALEAVWALLAYMSDKKSDKAIIHWIKHSRDGTDIQYFYHFGHLERFMLHELSEVFYQQHAGLFVSKEVRDLVYGYRAVAAGFYFAHRAEAVNAEGLTPIDKPEQAEKLKGIYEQLNQQLRLELDQRYRALEV